jgi:pimeloyl-ACP methyl ester carboxylesterase
MTIGSFLWRAFLLLDAVMICGVVLGTGYQALRTSRDRRMFPPPGRLIFVKGRRMHIHCIGESSPTVVIVPGSGVWSSQWSVIQRDLAKDVRACTYDRAGLGWSDPSTSPRTAQQAADELHELLLSAGEPSPFLLVGESYGGYVARLFHDKYPNQVAGMVLVESAHERQWEEIPRAKALLQDALPKLRIALWLSRIGFSRWKVADRGQDLPPDVRGPLVAAQAQTQTFQAILAEIAGVFASADQVARTHSLGSLPLVVVSAGHSFNKFVTPAHEPQLDHMNQTWLKLQDELTNLSTNSTHLTHPEATHGIAREHPAFVADAIRRAALCARVERRLSPESPDSREADTAIKLDASQR